MKKRTQSRARGAEASAPVPSPAIDLSGRVAVVTGGARNIGRAIALQLAAAGARVGVLDLDGDGATRTASDAEAARSAAAAPAAPAGLPSLGLRVDVAKPAQVRSAIAAVARRFGRIDILVNNAAYMGVPSAPVLQISLERWDRMQDVSLRGAHLCIQSALPYLRRSEAGRIINISSVVIWSGVAGCVDYVAAKGGLLGLTRGLARELGPDGITVNVVTPGAVLTPEEVNQATPSQVRAVIRAQCLSKRVVPADIGKAVLFLASHLADSVTGQTVNVDAGLVMH